MNTDTIYILGLAGTKCLIQTLENIIKYDDRKKILISRHCFSIGTLDKTSNLSHNQTIEDETNCEQEYYQLLEEMRSNGYSINSFTQGSSYGNILISRYSGIKIAKDSTLFEGNPYSKQPSKDMIDINNDLAEIFNTNINELDKQFIVDGLKTTHIRNGYCGCFLHDVKVYFTLCMFDYLMENEIIRPEILYINHDNIVYNYNIGSSSYQFKEYIVNPDKIIDYSKLFNKWLVDETNLKNIDYLITDPGPGYKKPGDELSMISQDFDDAITLLLIPKITNVLVSDETEQLSRSSFIMKHFESKIKNMDIYLNHSVLSIKSH